MNTKQEWKIGDCLELLPEIQDKSIDMILTDLPYGTTACSWDTVIPFEPLWEQYKRIIKDNGAILLFGSEPFSTFLRLSNINAFKYDWIWDKKQATGFSLCNVQPMKQHEIISVFGYNKTHYFPQMISRSKPLDTRKWKMDKRNSENGNYSSKDNSLSQKIYNEKFPCSIIEIHKSDNECNNTNRVHPTQKPASLFEYLIKTYTNEGDTVHDSCLGSGTTLEACMNTNRNCIGFEISDEWVSHYKKRLLLDNSKLTDSWGCKIEDINQSNKILVEV